MCNRARRVAKAKADVPFIYENIPRRGSSLNDSKAHHFDDGRIGLERETLVERLHERDNTRSIAEQSIDEALAEGMLVEELAPLDAPMRIHPTDPSRDVDFGYNYVSYLVWNESRSDFHKPAVAPESELANSSDGESDEGGYSSSLVGNKIEGPVLTLSKGEIALAVWGRDKVGDPTNENWKARALRLMESGDLPANKVGHGKYEVSHRVLTALSRIHGGQLSD